MIPPFEEAGRLPPGVHAASWAEVVERFGFNPGRRELLRRMETGLRLLAEAGCRRLWLDGSFVTAKPDPADYDACWDADETNIEALSELFFDFSEKRRLMKSVFGGELYPASWEVDAGGRTYLDFFQHDRDGSSKGIIALDPRDV